MVNDLNSAPRMPLGKIKNFIDGINFDSQHELMFYCWCKELRREGFIEKIDTQPEFKLFDGVRFLSKNGAIDDTLEPHEYHADFKLKWTSRARRILWGGCEPLPNPHEAGYVELKNTHLLNIFPLRQTDGISTIEIKPEITIDGKHGKRIRIDPGKREYFTRVNIKWVYQKYGVLVQIVKIRKLFEATFFPLACAKKLKDYDKRVILIEEYIKNMQK